LVITQFSFPKSKPRIQLSEVGSCSEMLVWLEAAPR